MQKFWGNLAVQLGKHAGIVAIVGLLLTVSLGFGITKLEFATGQDSYLNKSEQVYKDSVAYQDLFGGQAMLTLITMDEGHSVAEMLEEGNRTKIEAAAAEIADSPEVLAVLTPLDTLQFSANLLALSPETAASINQSTADAAADTELKASIAARGLLQNLIVRPAAKGKFEVEAGERRRKAMLRLAED